jgi:hypothetical protein
MPALIHPPSIIRPGELINEVRTPELPETQINESPISDAALESFEYDVSELDDLEEEFHGRPDAPQTRHEILLRRRQAAIERAVKASPRIWTRWVNLDCSTTGATSATVTFDMPIWTQWVTASNDTRIRFECQSTAAATSWSAWNEQLTSDLTAVQRWRRKPLPETEEQKRQRLEAEEVYRRDQETRRLAFIAEEAERKKQTAAAQVRAKALLDSLLTKEQQESLEKNGFFYVIGADGHMYKIGRGWSGNLERVDPTTKKTLVKFCVHPAKNVPVEDNLVAQKLYLETDPKTLLKTANVHFRDQTAPRALVEI